VNRCHATDERRATESRPAGERIHPQGFVQLRESMTTREALDQRLGDLIIKRIVAISQTATLYDRLRGSG
jgi:DNA topoisomerase IA